ncbi:MBL fold metallo-hydrolase [Paenibacillus sp. UNC451MF]|uniref:MBL fold metallo-hydrolase n=1 Tax=Paenibacillus sp. UNC451MF TaxID=1449063 RepID=UPI000690E65B|nr:MBL fold metallo-hydrolase [Paenibacillus sp. UNC451MF]
MMKIEMFPASYGDSFLISCNGKTTTNILIDMGFMSTYTNSIKNKLTEVKSKGESISLLVFTHIDEDHIAGGLKFLSENGKIENPNIVEIENIWFNSYRHIQFWKSDFEADESDVKNDSVLESIIGKGRPREKGNRDVQSVGAMQGSTLASLMYFNEYMNIWNRDFEYSAVTVEEILDNGVDNLRKITINDEVGITVLSPDENKLKQLETVWQEKLASAGYSKQIVSSKLMDDAFEIYTTNINSENPKLRKLYKVSSEKEETEIKNSLTNPFEADTTEVNGSSIAFILDFDGKRVLFLGDSHPDIIIKNLKIIKSAWNCERLWFDAVKISHHGSKHNTSVELLELIDSDKFIFSTNGRGKGFSHPDIETVYRVIATPNSKKKSLIFNYRPLHIISKIDKEEFKEKYNFEIKYTNDLSKSINNKNTTIIL